MVPVSWLRERFGIVVLAAAFACAPLSERLCAQDATMPGSGGADVSVSADSAPGTDATTSEAATAESTGATSVTSGDVTTGAVNPGDVTTGPVTTGPVTTGPMSEGAMEPTTSEGPMDVTTDASASPSGVTTGVDPMDLTTSEGGMPATTVTPDVTRPKPGEFSASPEEPTTGTRGQAATFHLKFEPTPGQTRRLTESNSEQMKLILPPDVEGGPSQERARLTTTTIVSNVSFEPNPAGGWKQAEAVQSFRRFEEGIAVPDPLVKLLSGARLVTRLDANGVYEGVEDPAGFLAGLMQRAPEAERPMLSSALSPDVIDHESRQGWQRKIGRYLQLPLRIGHPSFLVENGELGELGHMPYILCAIPSAIEPIGGKNCIRVDLVSFSANLKDGVMTGVPDEVESEFMAWVEGKDIAFSPNELSVYGAGEVLLELNGTGTIRYKNEETFHVAPARISRPVGGPIDAEEITITRVNTMVVE